MVKMVNYAEAVLVAGFILLGTLVLSASDSILYTAPCTTNESLYYVKPTSMPVCPRYLTRPCFSLEHYVSNSKEFFRSCTMFDFLNGEHMLVDAKMVSIENITSITFVSNGSATVLCHGESGFIFSAVRYLVIKGIQFSGCGAHVEHLPWSWGTLNGKSFWASIYLKNTYSFSISNSSIANSTGYGLLAFNPTGNSSVSSSIFKFSKGTTLNSTYIPGGNAAFIFGCEKCLPMKMFSSTLYITASLFLHGLQPTSNLSSGLVIAIMCCNVYTELDNITLHGNTNTASWGGNAGLYYGIFTNNSIVIKNTNISYGYETGLTFLTRSDMPITDPLSCGPSPTAKSHTLLYISNSIFYSNLKTAFYIDDHESSDQKCVQQFIVVENTVFMSNIGVSSPRSGIAVLVHRRDHLQEGTSLDLQVVFVKTTFANSTGKVTDVGESLLAAILVYLVPNVTFIDCTFKNNNMTAVLAYHSNVVFGGKTRFINNSALIGGGIALIEGSFMFLKLDVDMRFDGNKVFYVGGAIYTQHSIQVPPLNTICFYQIDTKLPLSFDTIKNIRCDIVNNSAAIAGSGIYGVTDERHCVTFQHPSNLTSGAIFQSIFHFKDNKPAISSATNDPAGVCPCTGQDVNCYQNVVHVTTYPGDSFQVWVLIVGLTGTFGEKYGVVPGVVWAEVVSSNATLAPLQVSQNTDATQCTPLNFSLFSVNKHEILHLRVERPLYTPPSAYFRQLNVSIALKKCPPGFDLSSSSQMCNCTSVLAKHHVQCYISSQTILRSPPSWIGFTNTGHSNADPQTAVLFQQNCPFDYCIEKAVNITVNKTDLQCAYNHSGILCGMCQPGLSVLIGSSRCELCSNRYLALLVGFAFAGLALVFLLVVSNLTISSGTINGLIFYANIVRINQTLFFPRVTTNILTVFIAWINLDLGIEACFFDGMDSFTQTWLQFVFPIYIWIIATVIIILSWRSPLVARMVGKNAVQMLATLFLLSYTKIQRTLVSALSFTTFTFLDGSKVYVWLRDGNIDYLKGRHIWLFTVACLVLLFVIIPFTIVLLFLRCLQANTHQKCLRWVQKIKPLLDAYGGPFKDKCRFWVGFLLLVRSFLFIVFTFGHPILNLLAVSIIELLIIILMGLHHGIYQHWPCDYLELLFHTNMGVLAIVTMYINYSKGNQYIATYISTSITFVVFIVIIIYRLQFIRRASDSLCNCICTAVCSQLRTHNKRDRPMATTPEHTTPRLSGVTVIRFNNRGELEVDQTECQTDAVLYSDSDSEQLEIY